MYALLANDTLYHTVDGGETWHKMPLPAPERPFDAAIDPSFPNASPLWPQRDLAVTRAWPNRVYVRAGRTLYRRSEGEDRWVPLLDRVDAWAVDEVAGDLLYAWRVSEPPHGLFASEDGGATWTHAYQGSFPSLVQGQDAPGVEGIASLAIDPSAPDVLYAGGGDGLYRSPDGGRTWARFEEGLPETAGASRRTLLLAGGPGSGPIYALTEVSTTPEDASAQAILARLDPGQDRWTVVGSDVLNMLAGDEYGFWGVYTVAVDPGQPERLYLGNVQGLWRSKDGGEMWAPANLGGGPDARPVGAVYRIAVRPGERSELYLWSDTGLHVHTFSTPMISPDEITQEIQLEGIGQVGGRSQAVAVTSGAVYLGIGPRIAGLGNSRLAGLEDFGFSPPLPGMVNDLVVDEEAAIAYVAAGRAGLAIVDVSFLPNARAVGQVETTYEARAVAVREGLAVVAEGGQGGGGGASIVDVALPDMPWLVARLELPGPGRGAALAGGHAYLVYEGGLIVLDLSDPATPVETARVSLPQCGGGIVVEDGLAYVAADGLRVLDLADPAQPRQVGHFKTMFCPSTVAVRAGRVTLADVFCEMGGCGSTLHVVDVSDPAAPREVGTWFSESAVQDLAVYNDVVYLASWQVGVEAVDVRDPADPTLLSAYGTLGEVADVVVEGDWAYVSDGAESGLRVLDLAPSPRGRIWPALRGVAEMRWAGGYAVAGGLAYVPVWGEGLRVVDVRDPDAPRELAVSDVGVAGQAVVTGDRAYVAVYDGLIVLDVADASSPRLLGRMALDGDQALGLAVGEEVAYLAVEATGGGDETETLYVVDVRDPENLRPIGAADIAGRGLRVTLAGSYAYVAVRGGTWAAPSGGVQVVDVSDPAQPRAAAFLDLPYGAFDVAVSGQRAFIAAGEAGVYVADVPDLRLTGHAATPGTASRVAVVEDRVYVAAGEGGLLVLQVVPVAQ